MRLGVWFLVIAACLLGCGPSDVDGSWEGTWTAGTESGTLILYIRQDLEGDDSVLDGTYGVDSSRGQAGPCSDGGGFDGTIDGDELTLDLKNSIPETHATLIGEVSGVDVSRTMEGELVFAPGASCPAESGTFELEVR
jgi:hypothetical protein